MKAQQETPQISEWTGSFGREYTDRNPQNAVALDALYRGNYGVTRRELNQRFLQTIPSSARILEVGCNIGNQLMLLQQLGYANLHGIEIQSYALEKARQQLPGAVFTEASAFAIPFPGESFDLVFTSGVLIRIAPADLSRALDEIHRVAKTWIWGLEYYAPASTEIRYRGHNGLLWKNDFAQVYLRRFADLELVREERLRYLDNENSDAMFLLRRTV
ncbi:MAG: methyltransferase domain-containing protein [Acidobacteriia bacterium]|nr:methyltransferase domain-containing protein [Terriglobia bacterium]